MIHSRINGGRDVVNLDDQQSKGTHWVSLFIDKNTIVYFSFFEIEYIPQEVLFEVFYCFAFIEYIIAGKSLLNYTNLLSPNNYKMNSKMIFSNLKTNMTSLDFRLKK